MNCPNCGAAIETKARFCPACGYDLTSKPEKGGLAGGGAKKRFRWLKLLLLLLVLVGGYFFFKEYEEPDPRDIVKGQLNALKTNQVTEAYYAYTSKDFQKVTTLEQFKEFIKSYPLLSQVKTVDLRVKEGPSEDLKIVEGDLVTQNKRILPVEYQMVLEDSKWRILYMRFLIHPTQGANPAAALSVSSNAAPAPKEELLPVVKSFLDALKGNRITLAYGNFTTKPFQDSTTLEAFRQFIEAYPVMKDFTAQQFGDYSITGASASLNVELRKDSRKTLMVFNLDRSGGEWKIQGIKHVQQTEEQGKVTELDSSKLSAVVRGQLQAIKQGEIPRAYYDFTSSQFRQGTTLDQFTAFVHANPVLSFNESIAFDELKYTHDVATFICTLRAAGGATTKVDYEMVMEGGFWKISKIHLEGGQAQKGAARMKPVAFDKAVFGTQVGEGGKILDPSQVLKARQSDIYVNLYLKGGTKGDIIQVQFEYLDNATKIPKVAYTLPQDGDQWITFNFSAPADGWPTGNYQLTMTSLSGTDKVFPFTIE